MFDLFENVIDLAQSKKTGGAALPFGETTTVKEVLAECQPEMVATEEGFSVGTLNGFAPIVVGETYIVSLNGTDYKVTTQAASERDIVFGNLSLMGMEDTGEPFFVSVAVLAGEENANYSGEIFMLDGSTTLTISIRQEVTEVQKISGKYVEGMGYKEPERIAFIENFTVVADKDHFITPNGAALSAPYAIEVGKNYTVIFDGVEYECESFQDGGVDILIGANNTDAWDVPFIVQVNGDSFGLVLKDKGEHTISLFGMVGVAHPIDESLIPSLAFIMYQRPGYDTEYYYDTDFVKPISRTEATTALKNGRVLYVCSLDDDGVWRNRICTEWDYTYYQEHDVWDLTFKTIDGKERYF